MYIILGLSFVLLFLFLSIKPQKESTRKIQNIAKKELRPKALPSLPTKSKFTFRKYSHIKKFYKDIINSAIEVGLRYNVPPPALLAIAGVESGYARGYVGRITGNILSLGANKNEPELPALYLPHVKNKPYKVVYGSSIRRYKKDDLIWRQRRKSLKKDYRPKSIAGTTKELDYLDTHPKARIEAYKECIVDFAKRWISKNKKFKPFQEARKMLNSAVKSSSKDILFSKELNEKFIKTISGRRNSFNPRKSWAPKVIKVMNKVGLTELCRAIYKKHKTFDKAWVEQ